MIAKHTLFRTAGLVAGALLISARLAGAAASEADALPVFSENYIKYSAGGIEDFNLTRELSKATTLVIDGQALPGAEDYLFQFKLTKNEVGTLEAGYKTFRTFYDGAGGFFPRDNSWLPLHARPLHVDRGRFFINATVALPKQPVFSLRYTNDRRDGRKDSTIWGETDFTGIPIYSLNSLNPVSAARKIVPAYLDIDERHERLELSVKHTFGNTTAVLAIAATRMDELNTRSIDKYPGELRPYPAVPANPVTIIPPAIGNNEQRGYDQHGLKEDGWDFTATVETVLSPKLTAYAGVAYHTASGDITADRSVDTIIRSATGVHVLRGGFNTGGRPPYSYTGAGTIDLDVYTANVGLRMAATKDLNLDVGVKAQDESVSGYKTSDYYATSVVLATGVVNPMVVRNTSSVRSTEKMWAPELNARYSGFKNLSFFGSVNLRQAPSDKRTNYGGLSVNTSAGTVSPGLTITTQDLKQKHVNAKLGTNWAPSSLLNVRAEAYTKDHQNRYDGAAATTGYYILDYDIYGTRVSATVRPLANWSLTTRYVTQFGKTAVTEDRFGRSDSNDSERHMLSETITWSPSKAFYLQGDATLVYDSINTAHGKVTGTAADVIRNTDNNYWNGSLVAGFVVDKLTNAQLQATYYRANNYDPLQAAGTLPYGASRKDYTVSVGVTRKLSDRWVGSAKVGYFDSRNDTSGGNSNYQGPLGYVSLQQVF